MANFFKKIFSDLDEEPETSEYYEEPQPEPAPVPAPVVSRSNKVVSINNARVSQQNLSSKIELIEPRVYGDGKEIVNHLLNGNAVIVNFDQMDTKVAFRIVEYMKGATYAINGKIERIDAEIFLCTPQRFEISGKLAPNHSRDGLDDGRGEQY
ncbi:cell division protein SepF [Limosilactobacillus gorillae]|jgi:cell division inhibitor SepF|uniref:cell division protein SepF n=1 Tax=Limosilactobacillus gorillae TaxID=1450649 RepID=UPI000AFCFE7A|nr:cell division protein SepF [Limosilactobacillus gorillae]